MNPRKAFGIALLSLPFLAMAVLSVRDLGWDFWIPWGMAGGTIGATVTAWWLLLGERKR